MRNTSAGWVKVDAVFVRERFDLGVLLQILRRDVLNVVIDREHGLRRIRDRRCSDLLELRNYGAGVVVRHHMTRANRDKIAASHHRAGSESIRMSCRNLLNQSQAHISFYLLEFASRKCA
jgi:hypothetical protein